jgi:adenylate cyclase class 2
MEEFEIKFLEVNVLKLEKKLLGIGAKKVGVLNYSRALLDYPDFRLEKDHSHLRLRTDGKEPTLTYKQRIGIKSNDGSIPDDGMKEIEIKVDDYEKTCELLKAIGFVVTREEKDKRVKYIKGDVIFDIDFWPQIPPYLEIESGSLEKVKDTALELGFNLQDGLICSHKEVFTRYGINQDEYSYISFEKMTKK